MKKLKWFGVFLLGLVCGFVVGVVFKYHKFPLVVAGEQMGSIAEWLGAIGTIGAVIIALNNRWDFWAPIAKTKLDEKTDEFNSRFNKQYKFINAYSNFVMCYTEVFKKIHEGKKINNQECLEELTNLVENLKVVNILENIDDFLDEIMKMLTKMDASSADFEINLEKFIVMVSGKGDDIRSGIKTYMDKNKSLQEEIQILKKKYEIPEELVK